MKLLWFPRIQTDVDKMHITTWREMYRSLCRLGVDVKLAIIGRDEAGVLAGIPYIRIALIRKRFLRILSFWVDGYFKFAKHYISGKPDVVLLDVHSFWFSFPFALRRRRHCVFVLDNRTPHFDLYGQEGLQNKVMAHYVRLSYAYIRRFFDGQTVITEHYKKQTMKDFDFGEHQVGVWNSGVDTETFDPSTPAGPRPAALEGKFVLMQHGTFTYDRGLFESVKALSLVENENVCLLLIGDSVPGTEIKAELTGLAEELGVADRLCILPPVPHKEIPRHVAAADCAIMAYPNVEYWNNNNPIKLLEYLAMGKVVVCTDMPCFRDVMQDSLCARYVAGHGNDPQQVAAAIDQLYEQRHNLKEWGAGGIRIVASQYTWDMQAKKLHDFCQRLQDSRPHGTKQS